MGAVRSKISKIVSNSAMNETRMHREISKEKPRHAPRHPSTEQAFKNLINENPVLQDIDKVKDTEYLKLLSDLKVDSVDEKVPNDNLRSLSSRNEGQRLVPGKVTCEQIFEMFSLRRHDPQEWTPEKIAKKYYLAEGVVNNILLNYSSFNVLKIKKEESPFKKVDLI